MKKEVLLIVAFILLAIVIVLAVYSSKTADLPPRYSCIEDSDCVPASCCHSTEAVNVYYKPDCSAVSCTASCEGPLDCGAGKIECISNRCTIVPTAYP